MTLQPDPHSLPPALAALFQREGLALPPVPAGLAAGLRPDGELAFCTPGAPGGDSLPAALDSWLAQPQVPFAWVGFTGRGMRSTVVRLVVATPGIGLFMQRVWSDAFNDAQALRRQVDGAFGLAGMLLTQMDALQARKQAPDGLRLVLVDDDLRARSWGWAPLESAARAALEADELASLKALLALQSLDATAQAPA